MDTEEAPIVKDQSKGVERVDLEKGISGSVTVRLDQESAYILRLAASAVSELMSGKDKGAFALRDDVELNVGNQSKEDARERLDSISTVLAYALAEMDSR